MNEEARLGVLENAARLGGLAAKNLRQEKGGNLAQRSKDASGRNIVTEGDEAAQAVIIASLRNSFPDLPIVGEEKDKAANKQAAAAPEKFVVDPVDGTTNYANGSANWGTTVAYIQHGKPRAGVIFFPDHGIMVTAEEGKGCFLNAEPLAVAWDKNLLHSVIGTEWGHWIDEKRLQQQCKIVTAAKGTHATLAATYSILELLRGETHGYINLSEPGKGASIWDFAAGYILLHEALGLPADQEVVVAANGSPIDWNDLDMEVVFAATQSLAQEIVTVLNS